MPLPAGVNCNTMLSGGQLTQSTSINLNNTANFAQGASYQDAPRQPYQLNPLYNGY